MAKIRTNNAPKRKIGDTLVSDEDDSKWNKDIIDAEERESKQYNLRRQVIINKQGKTVEQYDSEYPDEETYNKKMSDAERGRLIKDRRGSVETKVKIKSNNSRS